MRMMMAAAVCVVAVGAAAQEPSLQEVLARAGRYAAEYEQRFSALVAEEHSVQETVRQTAGGGGNLSRDNPGGGFVATGGRDERRVLRAEYLLARLDGGWMPFRDVFERPVTRATSGRRAPIPTIGDFR